MRKRGSPRRRKRQPSKRNGSGQHQQDLTKELDVRHKHKLIKRRRSRPAQPSTLRTQLASRKNKTLPKPRRRRLNNVKQRLRSKGLWIKVFQLRLLLLPHKSPSQEPHTKLKLNRNQKHQVPVANLAKDQQPKKKRKAIVIMTKTLTRVAIWRAVLQKSSRSSSAWLLQRPRTRTCSQPQQARSSTWPSRLLKEKERAAQPACFHTQPRRRQRQ
mgnify:CR=1 FL=1